MRRPFRLGLTGSIGMGKSTTAAMFRDEGVPVWDADEAVRRLYAPGGAGVEAVARVCPDAIDADRGVSKDSLRQRIAADPSLLDRVSAEVHPLVKADREGFAAGARADIVVLDRDPFDLHEDDIGSADPVTAWARGAEVYRRDH